MKWGEKSDVIGAHGVGIEPEQRPVPTFASARLLVRAGIDNRLCRELRHMM
jgi:hypothetical protein